MAAAPFDLASLSPETVELSALEPFWPECPRSGLKELAAAIEAEGLRRPLWLWPDGPGAFKVAAGARRLKALKMLGRKEAPALIMPAGIPRGQALAAALADNSARGYNWAEVALIWKFLTEKEPDLADGLAEIIGLGSSPKLKDRCLDVCRLPLPALEMVADGRLELEIAARLAGLAPADQRAALDLFTFLAPSRQKKKQWLDWLEDIARRESIGIADILDAAELKAILSEVERKGRPAVEESARQFIWARRHPLLAELAQTRAEQLRRLNLPPSARLELDPSFEDLHFTFQLRFSTPEEYERLADLLAGLKNDPDFQKIMDDADA
ncbi:ParB N-terminal domain-containing protein [Deltaproteobacteria bacterium OttesenSCG-928-K17]|nr:ParB N-terminal domain-containing protein [Deltaproteobacteria bacterium OttesenSCG-928-K17]